MYLLNILKRQVQTGEKGIRTPETFWSRKIGLSRDLPLYSENSEKAWFFLPSQYVKGSEHILPLDFYRQCWHEQNIIRENWNIISIYRYTFFPKPYVWFLFGNPVQNAMCFLAAQTYWEPQCSGQIQLLKGFVHQRQRQSFTSEERWCKAVSCT